VTSPLKRAVIFAILALLGAARSAAASQPIVFDHRGDRLQTQRVSVSNGTRLSISIEHTCPADFDYEIKGVGLSNPPAGVRTQAVGDKPSLQTVAVGTVEADENYSGFFVIATRRPGSKPTCYASQADAEPVALQTVTFFLITDVEGWELAFGGGFTFSTLRNEVYAVRDTGAGAQVVVRDQDKEDSVSLGLAAMTDLYHSRLPQVALSFGLGIREDNKAQYFLGGGIRFGKRATLHAGLTIGSIATLPAGVREGDAIADVNLLNNLGQRTEVRPFVAISYSFLGSGNRMKLPFGEPNPQ
jgi:hypothetical protein